MNIKTLIRLAFGIALLALIVSQVDIREVLQLLRNVEPLWLVIGFGLALPGVLISTLKWMILLRVQAIRGFSFLRLWKLYFLGIFFSNFLPTEVGGDAVRSYFVGRPYGKVPEALAAVFIERVTGFAAVIVYAVLGSLLNWSLANQYGLALVSFAALLALAVGVPALAHPKLGSWLEQRPSETKFGWVWRKLQSFQQGLSLYRPSGVLSTAMVISFVNQAISILIVYAFAVAIGVQIDLRLLLLIVPIIVLIGVLPITISGLGIREGAFVVLLTAVGVSPDPAFAIALLSRLGLVFPALIGGLLYAATPTRYTLKDLHPTPHHNSGR